MFKDSPSGMSDKLVIQKQNTILLSGVSAEEILRFAATYINTPIQGFIMNKAGKHVFMFNPKVTWPRPSHNPV